MDSTYLLLQVKRKVQILHFPFDLTAFHEISAFDI